MGPMGPVTLVHESHKSDPVAELRAQMPARGYAPGSPLLAPRF
jgi:hypothetical protein